ncbi:MAG: DUF3034 family protein [Gammaproteobacteria bacterium]|nr:DUF3034 family protein [Gammaproteobacteria bacterium]
MTHALLAMTLLAVTHGAAAGSRIIATGGASPIEGGGGGGLSPWAVITGYASTEEFAVTGFATRVDVRDFTLSSRGAAIGWNDRLEISYTRQALDVDPLDATLKQDIFGVKARLYGHLLYSAWPQISVGVQHKRNRTFALPEALGARDDSGIDVYVSASRLWFAALFDRNVFANVTARRTRANETGLLGFGAPGESHSMVVESSVGVFINNHWVVGYEYRQKPDHLASVEENDWQDVFIGYFPNKHLSIVAARVALDEIAGLPDQDGWYLSLQAGF